MKLSPAIVIVMAACADWPAHAPKPAAQELLFAQQAAQYLIIRNRDVLKITRCCKALFHAHSRISA